MASSSAINPSPSGSISGPQGVPAAPPPPLKPAPVAPPAIPPPPGGGTPVVNPHYQGSLAAPVSAQPSTPTASSAPVAPNIPPPPGGGTPVANPHYQGALPSVSASDPTIPRFLRNGINMGDVTQSVDQPSAGQSNTVADVDASNPNHVSVLQPNNYTDDIRDHELTHVYQDSHGEGEKLNSDESDLGQITPDHDPYDYSGDKVSSRTLPYEKQMAAKLTGLRQALDNHKTVADFNVEQQAEIVRDYAKQHTAFLQRVKDGTATKKDLRDMSELQKVYHPFVQQLADMPRNNRLTDLLQKHGYSIPALHGDSLHALLYTLTGHGAPSMPNRAEAPGLPSFDTPGLGVVTADPLMSGYSEPIRNIKK